MYLSEDHIYFHHLDWWTEILRHYQFCMHISISVLQGSGIIKMIRNLAQSGQLSYQHCTQKDVYGTTRTCDIKIRPDRTKFFTCTCRKSFSLKACILTDILYKSTFETKPLLNNIFYVQISEKCHNFWQNFMDRPIYKDIYIRYSVSKENDRFGGSVLILLTTSVWWPVASVTLKSRSNENSQDS